MATRTLSVIISGDPKSVLGAMGATARAADSTSSRFGRFQKVATAAFLGIAGGAVAAGVGLFKLGAEFDSAFDKIRVGTGATGAALEGLKTDFKEVLKDTPASFDDASSAIADLNTRLGLTGKPLQELSTQMLNLSRITDTDLGENIESVTRLFGDFSIAAEDQGAALDQLYRASQATGIGVSDLSRLMVQFGSPLRQLGFDFETTAAMFGQFEKAGVNIQTVLPGLKMGLKNFAEAGRDPAEALVETIEAIKNAATTADANTIAFEVFGARAGADLAAAVREGRFELDDLIATISGGSDTINQAALDTEDFGEKWTKLKNRVFVALEPLATKVFDGVGKAMDDLAPKVEDLAVWIEDELAPAAEDFGKWLKDDFGPELQKVGDTVGEVLLPAIKEVATFFKENKWATQALATFAAIAIAVGTISAVFAKLGIVGTLFKGVGKVILGIIGAAVAAAGPLLFMLQGPITLIGLIAFGLYQLGQLFWSIFGETIKNAVGAGLAAFTGFWNLLVALIGWISNNWRHLAALIVGTITGAMAIASAVFRGFGAVSNAILGAAAATSRAVARVIGAVFRSGLSIAAGAWRGLWGTVSWVRGAIAGAIGWLRGAIAGAFKWAIGVARGAWDGLWGKVKEVRDSIGAAVDWVKGKIAGLSSAISNIPGAGVVKNIAGFIGQHGGIVPGSYSQPVPSLLHGSEMVLNPGQQANLFNAIASGAVGAGGGGGGTTVVNVSFAGAIISSKEDARRWVTEALNEALRLDHRAVTVRGRTLAT